MSTETKIQAKATEALRAYEKRTREDSTEFWAHVDGRPEWVFEMSYSVHDGSLPSDWIFGTIVEMLDTIVEADDADEIYPEADIYTGDLLAWLGESCQRPSYCDEAREEMGLEDFDTMTLIGAGQIQHKREILAGLISALNEAVEADEDDDDDDDSE